VVKIIIKANTKFFDFPSLFKAAIFTVLFVVCMSSTVFACTCVNSRPFFDITSNADLVVIGKPISYGEVSQFSSQPLSADVEIQRVLKGNASLEKIRVFGDNGALCRPYVTKFPLNTTWVFALNFLATGSNGEPQYAISGCGEFSLKVKAGRVFGRIKSSQQTSAILPRFIKSVRP
jgi:hypothetical protein